MQVIAVGHSMVYGNWDPEGGWVQRLRSHLDERALEEQDEELVSEIINLGIPGEDSSELLERIEPEIRRRLWDEVETTTVVMTGANDFQRLVDEDRIRVPREEYRENLEEILEIVDRLSEHVVLVGELYTAIDGPIPYAEGKALDDDRLEEYVEIQREVSREKGVDMIDLRSLRSKEEWCDMLEDGIHPDGDGHDLIYRKVREELEQEDLL